MSLHEVGSRFYERAAQSDTRVWGSHSASIPGYGVTPPEVNGYTPRNGGVGHPEMGAWTLQW